MSGILTSPYARSRSYLSVSDIFVSPNIMVAQQISFGSTADHYEARGGANHVTARRDRPPVSMRYEVFERDIGIYEHFNGVVIVPYWGARYDIEGQSMTGISINSHCLGWSYAYLTHGSVADVYKVRSGTQGALDFGSSLSGSYVGGFAYRAFKMVIKKISRNRVGALTETITFDMEEVC